MMAAASSPVIRTPVLGTLATEGRFPTVRVPFSRPLLSLTAVAVASTALVALAPAHAAYRPGSATTDRSGDAKTVAGAPSARQTKMSDVRHLRFEWARSAAGDDSVMVSYRVPDRAGTGPQTYAARDDISLDYRTAEGTEHRALIALDKTDTSGGPWGTYTMEGPHVADAEAAGVDCGPSYSAVTESGSYTEVSGDVFTACLGDLEAVTGIRLVHTSRFNGAKVTDTAKLSDSATVPATPVWRHRAVSDPKGDSAYSSWRDERFADLLALRYDYSATSDRVTATVKLAALSGSHGPRQQLRLDLLGEDYQSAYAYVPGSGGKAGSFSVPKCAGEKMSLNRGTRTLALSFPADCVGDRDLAVDVWSMALRHGSFSSSDWVGEQNGITLF